MNQVVFRRVLAWAALGVAAITVTLVLMSREQIPEWKQRLLQLPIMKMPENPNPRTSPESLARHMYLVNDLRRRELWARAEVDDILNMLHGSPLDLVPMEGITSDADWDAQSLSEEASVAIRTRIGIGAPIDPVHRRRLVDGLLARSHAAKAGIRLGLAEAFCWSGLIFEDERVDERVREMMNDPEPRVAANARSQYRFHSEGREKWAEYQRRQGRDIPSEGG